MGYDNGYGAEEPLSDFGAHLQRRLGISRYELGECLTHYQPSRPYPILIGPADAAAAQFSASAAE